MNKIDTYPVFPLNTVLFPGCKLPLRIFEQRYLRMVSECTQAEKPFVISLIKSGREVGEESVAHQVGTFAKIVDFNQGQTGILDIKCEAGSRVLITECFYEADKLMRGKIEPYSETELADLPENYVSLKQVLASLNEQGIDLFNQAQKNLTATEISFCLSYLAPVSLPAKQRLLELQDTESRLSQLKKLFGTTRFTFTA